MAMLVPRLTMNDRAVRQLRHFAEERGVPVADVIAAIVENRLNVDNGPQDANEVLFRIILVGERYGLTVGGNRLFPASWTDVGGITEETCRHLAELFIAWRRRQNEDQQGAC